MLAPRLSRSAHKGSCGRIAVVGGCDEYTGAPFFSAMAALRMGADQSTIFTCASAATPIKAYSPDICVTPSYERIFEQLTKYHAVVVGPGLGRDLSVTPSLVERIMAGCVAQKIPLLLDADALFVLPPLAGILKGYVWAVLTPNVVELKRLCEQLNVVEHTGPALALALQGPIVVVKGEVDTISGPAGPQPSSVSEGSPRRVSGQGDILAGVIATFLAWGRMRGDLGMPEADVVAMCAKAGCDTMRRVAIMASEAKGRGVVTSDILERITLVSSTF